jgi:dipeptidase E
MKYYLSSSKLGENPEYLAELFFGWKKIGIVPNAYDLARTDKEKWETKMNLWINSLVAIGLQPSVVDLQDYFGKQDELQKVIDQLNGVYIPWWNVFTLRQAMHLSWCDAILKEKAKDRQFVYAWSSSWISILSPSLEWLEIVDNPEENLYACEDILQDWLGLYPNLLIPHYKSDHYESPLMSNVVNYCINNDIPFETISDWKVIIID